MTVVTSDGNNKLTFSEYLACAADTDLRHELIDGELVTKSIGNGLHGAILKFIEKLFDAEIARLGLGLIALQAAVGVKSPRRGRWDTNRVPDVSVIARGQWDEMRDKEAIIELNEPPPSLVVEVVSTNTRRTDYRSKRAEYMVLGITEYWIVDPEQKMVTVLALVDDWYEPTEYTGNNLVGSLLFPQLEVTATQILNAGS